MSSKKFQNLFFLLTKSLNLFQRTMSNKNFLSFLSFLFFLFPILPFFNFLLFSSSDQLPFLAEALLPFSFTFCFLSPFPSFPSFLSFLGRAHLVGFPLPAILFVNFPYVGFYEWATHHLGGHVPLMHVFSLFKSSFPFLFI